MDFHGNGIETRWTMTYRKHMGIKITIKKERKKLLVSNFHEWFCITKASHLKLKRSKKIHNLGKGVLEGIY